MKIYINHFISLIVCSMIPAIIFSVYFIVIAVLDNSFGSLFKELYFLFFFVTVVALIHAFLFGLPLYLLIKKYGKFTYTVTAICGFIVGALPLSIYGWPYSEPGSSSTINGVETVVNGIPTVAGWLSYFQQALVLGIVGLIAALVFKYLLSKSSASNKSLNQDATSVAPIS